MSADRAFIDTNVLGYAYSSNVKDAVKSIKAYETMKLYKCRISTQVVNEFCNVCIRKQGLTAIEVKQILASIYSYCYVSYVYEHTINKALDIQSRYDFSYYDSLIIASALASDCEYLLSEDMSDGQVIEDGLTIVNIFK